MNTKQFADKLNGREYGAELSRDEAKAAAEFNLVIVFGYSDDNMEFRGAIYGEIECYVGGVAYLTCDGLQQVKNNAETIKAVWGRNGYSWTYKTTIPHETFNIFEDGRLYCRGIVFDLGDIKK